MSILVVVLSVFGGLVGLLVVVFLVGFFWMATKKDPVPDPAVHFKERIGARPGDGSYEGELEVGKPPKWSELRESITADMQVFDDHEELDRVVSGKETAAPAPLTSVWSRVSTNQTDFDALVQKAEANGYAPASAPVRNNRLSVLGNLDPISRRESVTIDNMMNEILDDEKYDDASTGEGSDLDLRSSGDTSSLVDTPAALPAEMFGENKESPARSPITAVNASEAEMPCVVCLTDQRSTVFAPCGHMCCCEECAETIYNFPDGRAICPMCRSELDSVIRNVVIS